jgi:hypothetical protein
MTFGWPRPQFSFTRPLSALSYINFSSLAGEVGLQQVVLGNRVRSVRFNVRFGSFADIRTAKLAVRFVP